MTDKQNKWWQWITARVWIVGLAAVIVLGVLAAWLWHWTWWPWS